MNSLFTPFPKIVIEGLRTNNYIEQKRFKKDKTIQYSFSKWLELVVSMFYPKPRLILNLQGRVWVQLWINGNVVIGGEFHLLSTPKILH